MLNDSNLVEHQNQQNGWEKNESDNYAFFASNYQVKFDRKESCYHVFCHGIPYCTVDLEGNFFDTEFDQPFHDNSKRDAILRLIEISKSTFGQ